MSNIQNYVSENLNFDVKYASENQTSDQIEQSIRALLAGNGWDPEDAGFTVDEVIAEAQSQADGIREQKARERVENNEALSVHTDTIFADWENAQEHIAWVATAPEAEIIAWAEEIEKSK